MVPGFLCFFIEIADYYGQSDTHSMETHPKLIEENLGLAQIIAVDYLNIPGATLGEVLSDAYEALTRAAGGFDPAKGDFEPYAATAIRNALNSLYHKQMKLAKMFPKSLDDCSADPTADASSVESPIARVADRKADVVRNVRRMESKDVLEEVLLVLSPRERLVIERIKGGSSLQEIAEKMGISKQAVHKISQPAMEKLRNRLSQLGYKGLDSSGFLRSFPEKQVKG